MSENDEIMLFELGQFSIPRVWAHVELSQVHWNSSALNPLD